MSGFKVTFSGNKKIDVTFSNFKMKLPAASGRGIKME